MIPILKVNKILFEIGMKAIVFFELVFLIFEKIQGLFQGFRETFEFHVDLFLIHFFEGLLKEEYFLIDDVSDILEFFLDFKRQSNWINLLFFLFLFFQDQNTLLNVLESALYMRQCQVDR